MTKNEDKYSLNSLSKMYIRYYIKVANINKKQ